MRYLSVLSKENTNTGTNLTDEEAIFLLAALKDFPKVLSGFAARKIQP